MNLSAKHVDSRTVHRIGNIFWYRGCDQHLLRPGNDLSEPCAPTGVQLGEDIIQNQHGFPVTVGAGI